MTCVCFCCAGSGFCSNLLSIIVSITFTFHALGITTWHWMCKGEGCSTQGLYYTCSTDGCIRRVENASLLTLCIIILISNFTLMVALCCIMHCSKFRWKSLTLGLALFVGGWYGIQEILSLSVLITLAAQYDVIGWSAYVFTVPGIIFLAVIVLVLVYMMCGDPENRVFPNSKV